MPEPDNQLIAEFNARRSEEAFAALVRQHVNLVFATALRQVGDGGAAEEITQNVFVALAQSAGKLGSHPTIAGWLYQTTLNKSREWLRAELRRRRREQTAVELELARAEGDSVWSSLVPLLDEALLRLREPDRLAVILHFMEGQTYREVGTVLGVGEDAARKRVNGCLGQLTDFFHQRGFTVPALAAGAPLFTLSSHAVPAGLVSSATTAGLAAAHYTTSTLTLIKGALKIMAWTKTNTAIVVGVVVLLAAGTATVAVRKIAEHKNSNTWWEIEKTRLQTAHGPLPPVLLASSKFPPQEETSGDDSGRPVGTGATLMDLVDAAYNSTAVRTILPNDSSSEKYDFIADLPHGSKEALQREIEKQLRLVGRRRTIKTDVLLLTMKNPGAHGLRPAASGINGSATIDAPGKVSCTNRPLFSLAFELESYFKVPVIDRTGITNHFDISLQWEEPNFEHPDPKDVKQALLDQLGLELVPTNMPVKMLVVNKAAN